MQLKCLNAETPDKYGHYREAQFSQIKHHWFWKVRKWKFCIVLIAMVMFANIIQLHLIAY